MSDTQTAASMRINSMLDANSFVEIGGMVTARATDFNLSAKAAPNDGVITGYGTVEGSLVYVYSQDVSVLGGTIGEMHAKKIVNLYTLARRTGAPVIGILDSNGIRLEESTDALFALGQIYRTMVLASGVIPQITAVFGSCGGGLSFIPALSDFAFMTDSAKLFVNVPDAVIGESVDTLSNQSAEYQAESNNVAVIGTEEEVYAKVRQLISLLPVNNADEGDIIPCADDPNRSVAGIETLTGNAADILGQIADGGIFFETGKTSGHNMVTGFLRLNGLTVGAVANRGDKDTLCPMDAGKAAKFINFCDAFNIPVLTLVNVQGLARKERAERMLPKAAARLTYAYANATVPKVTLVTGKAYGSAYVVMGSKPLADYVYAWPNAEIGTMDSKLAGKVLAADGDAAAQRKAAADYQALQSNVASAAARGYVDTVIDAADTRKYLIGAFEMLYTKRESRPDKKHGTI